uniref:Uncharacterized protein n=1 Tax=Myripristis murdjan TaxID=586833 RepID=A0A667Y9M7_9TELE
MSGNRSGTPSPRRRAPHSTPSRGRTGVPTGETKTASIDFCSLVACRGGDQKWIWSVKYLCRVPPRPAHAGVGYYSGYREDVHWGDCPWHTGTEDWGYTTSSCPDLHKRLSLIKSPMPPNCGPGECNPLLITLKNPQLCDSGNYRLYAWLSGTDPFGGIVIKVIPKPASPPAAQNATADDTDGPVTYLSNLTFSDVLTLETGLTTDNEWLRWMEYTAKQQNRSNCIVCSSPKPRLGTVPFALDPETDPVGLQCILQMFHRSYSSTGRCASLSLLFPRLKRDGKGLPFSVAAYKGNYTCFMRTGSGTNVTTFPPGYCSSVINITSDTANYSSSWFLNHTVSRSDVWWLCGDLSLRPRLPKDWTGSCALTQLLMPFLILPNTDLSDLANPSLPYGLLRRLKRSAPGGTFDNTVYIDSVGVPRGVPNEYKARNQIAAGFESLFFWWSTINKNVDWINYLYYNQQRFVNYSRDAIKGLAEQVEATSLMTWQNRMALDMLLAEKGGVCKMFGDTCCTYIPNNTAPDGSVTKALEGLTSLSIELAENAGVDDPFADFLESWFGKWRNLAMSLFISMGVMAALLILCGCCCIPCIRGLLQKLIDHSLTKTMLRSTRLTFLKGEDPVDEVLVV